MPEYIKREMWCDAKNVNTQLQHGKVFMRAQNRIIWYPATIFALSANGRMVADDGN